MNMGIVASFVIGGLLMISLLTLNSRVMIDSSRSTQDLVNKQRLDGMRQLVNNDFSKIAFGEDATGIKEFSSTEIKFEADVEGNGVQEVIWEFKTNDPATNTKNPNDYRLVRTLKNANTNAVISEIALPVTDFELTGYNTTTYDPDATNQTTSIAKDIKAVLIEITYESAEPIDQDSDGNDIYSSSAWSTFIVPTNLLFKRQELYINQ